MFAIGDVVECIDIAPRSLHPLILKHLSYLKLKGIYRVSGVFESPAGLGVTLQGIELGFNDHNGHRFTYFPDRFVPIIDNEEFDFRKMMKPVGKSLVKVGD